MRTRRETCIQIAAWIAALVKPVCGRAQGRNEGELTVPLEFAADRGSLLVHVRVDHRPALLIIDTGSTHTILRPSVVGMSAAELASPRTGGGFIGDAVGREVTFEVGERRWQRRRIAVMDLSQTLSVYKERIDGLLGLDVLLEFSQAVIHFKNRTVTLIP